MEKFTAVSGPAAPMLTPNVDTDVIIPIQRLVGTGRAVNEVIKVGGRTFRFTSVSMGNPHCVIFVPKVKDFPVAEFGPQIEWCKWWPKKVNVEFVEVVSRREVRQRTWERGRVRVVVRMRVRHGGWPHSRDRLHGPHDPQQKCHLQHCRQARNHARRDYGGFLA